MHAPSPRGDTTAQDTVRPEWIDYNGHMNVAYYVLAFDLATDTFLDTLGLDAAYRTRSAHSTFALELHVNYLREIAADAPYIITTRLLDADHKRLHLFHEMHHEQAGWLVATNEVLTMHIDMARKRSAAFPPDVQIRVETTRTRHARLPRPPQAGSVMGIRRGG